MSILNVYRKIQLIYPYSVIIIENTSKYDRFKRYYIYGIDMYIILYIYYIEEKKIKEYKYVPIEKNDNKYIIIKNYIKNEIINLLEKYNISYIIISKRNNYEVIEDKNLNNIEEYIKLSKKAKIYISKKDRINKVCNNLKKY